jgi:uncharacterized protein YcbK (DUF882 family)
MTLFSSSRFLVSLATAGVLGTLPAVATGSLASPSSGGARTQASAPTTSAAVGTSAATPAVAPAVVAALPRAWAHRGHSGALRALVADPGSALDEALELSEAQRAALAYRWQARGGAAVPSAKATGAQSAQAPSAHAPSAHALREGLRAPARPGVYSLQLGEAAGAEGLQLIAPVAHDGKSAHLNGYHVGRYPADAAQRMGERYTPPSRFIEVTRENQDTFVSEHFQLRQFLTKDQRDVWPKYLVLDLALVDKLELVVQELQKDGFAKRGLHVMSGFRTPQYNGPGGNGRAKYSRHTYGDAADVWVDDDRDGRMDDLDRNGRVDQKDAEVLAAAVDRVEQRVPALVGGHGTYKANSAHGPFVHVDVRGSAARWAKR